LKLTEDEIASLAERARAVVIRSVSHRNVCVVSRDDSDPIKRLRHKLDLSQSHMKGDMLGGDITFSYASDQWEGAPQEISALTNRWAHDRGNPAGMKSLYWACGNARGLHFWPCAGLNSGWHSSRGADIEVLIDAPAPSGHEKFARDVINTNGLWDVMTWDSKQTEAFISAMGPDGGDQSHWRVLASLLHDAGLDAKKILLEFANSTALLYTLLAKRRALGQDVPDLPHAKEMIKFLKTVLVAEGYRLKEDVFVDFIAHLANTLPGMAPQWNGSQIGDIFLNGTAVPPGDLADLALDDTQGAEWRLLVSITTTEPAGTIFARSFANGMWQKGQDGSQCKMLFTMGGVLCFDIGWVGCLQGTTRVDDGLPHLVGVELRDRQYVLLVDDQVDATVTTNKKTLPLVKDPPETMFFKELAIAVPDDTMLRNALAVQKLRQPGGGLHGLSQPWFWQPGSRFLVGVNFTLEDVLEVDANREVASLRFTLEFHWYHPQLCDWSKRDDSFANFDEACTDAGEPQPSFPNATEDPVFSSITRRRDMSASCIVTTFCGSGIFYDPVNVRDFPFDSQDFPVVIKVHGGSLGIARQLVPMEFLPERVAKTNTANLNPEWVIAQPTFKFEETQFTVGIRMKRKPNYYLMNIVLPLAVIGTLSFTVFVIEADSFADRFSVLGTIMLTAIASKFTYADSTPKVTYQTWMDKYVLSIFVFLGILTVVLAGVTAYIVEQEDSDDFRKFDLSCFVAFGIAWLVGHASVLAKVIRS
jgi:hypothetical protein